MNSQHGISPGCSGLPTGAWLIIGFPPLTMKRILSFRSHQRVYWANVIALLFSRIVKDYVATKARSRTARCGRSALLVHSHQSCKFTVTSPGYNFSNQNPLPMPNP